jgi:magnesium-transporting ATPase (P-type)
VGDIRTTTVRYFFFFALFVLSLFSANISLKYRSEEIPFDSVTKWMAVRSQAPDDERPKYYVKGALDTVLPKCSTFYDNSQSRSEINEAHRRLADQVYCGCASM